MTQIKWNWQKDDWTKFTYDNSEIEELERDYSGQSGFSLGIARHLSSEDQDDLIVELISNEAIKTSEIEGEFLDRESLQSSIRREFGLGLPNYHNHCCPIVSSKVKAVEKQTVGVHQEALAAPKLIFCQRGLTEEPEESGKSICQAWL